MILNFQTCYCCLCFCKSIQIRKTLIKGLMESFILQTLKLIWAGLLLHVKRSFSKLDNIKPVDPEALIFHLECVFAKNVDSPCFKQKALQFKGESINSGRSVRSKGSHNIRAVFQSVFRRKSVLSTVKGQFHLNGCSCFWKNQLTVSCTSEGSNGHALFLSEAGMSAAEVCQIRRRM